MIKARRKARTTAARPGKATGPGRQLEATRPSLVVLDRGAATAFTTTTFQSDMYAVIFDQSGLMGGVGVQGSVSFLPADLEPYYGDRNPLGFSIFASLRPAAMSRGDRAMPGPTPTTAPPSDHEGHEMQ